MYKKVNGKKVKLTPKEVEKRKEEEQKYVQEVTDKVTSENMAKTAMEKMLDMANCTVEEKECLFKCLNI